MYTAIKEMPSLQSIPHDVQPVLLGESTFRALVGTEKTPLIARPHDGGFVLQAHLPGDQWVQLGNARDAPRVFAALNTLALLLQKWGHEGFVVDVRGYVPRRVRLARPERSAAMKRGQLPIKKKSSPLAVKKTTTK